VEYFRCCGTSNKTKQKKAERRKKKRWICCIVVLLFMLIALILALALILTRKGGIEDTPVQSQWLNLTGYPPIPTGVMTVAQPTLRASVAACVNPSTMWSCALPKEEQQSVAPANPDQPNFRFAITFSNGSITNTSLTQAAIVRPKTSSSRSRLKVRENFHSQNIFSALPDPPSLEDQMFLGNTTDNNTAPFEGEKTPFFVSFMNATQLPPSRTGLEKRATSTTSSSSTIDLTTVIPAPSTNDDGTAAAANLLPLPSGQALKIYDRGLDTEHYGFYVYYDRSIFMKSIQFHNSTVVGEVPADQNGGSTFDGANARCTWTQTRYVVQIWTRSEASARLLSTSSDDSVPSSSMTASSASGAGNSSANVFSQPGSFPYPVTITIDRHGGNNEEKMIYCYGMDDRGRIVADDKLLQVESRSVGGTLVNPSRGPFNNVTVSTEDGGPGGIDGGTGGCLCQWTNWAART